MSTEPGDLPATKEQIRIIEDLNARANELGQRMASYKKQLDPLVVINKRLAFMAEMLFGSGGANMTRDRAAAEMVWMGTWFLPMFEQALEEVHRAVLTEPLPPGVKLR